MHNYRAKWKLQTWTILSRYRKKTGYQCASFPLPAWEVLPVWHMQVPGSPPGRCSLACWRGIQAHPCHFHYILRKLQLWVMVQNPDLIPCVQLASGHMGRIHGGHSFALPLLPVPTGKAPLAHNPPDSSACCSSKNSQASVPTRYKIMQTSQ